MPIEFIDLDSEIEDPLGGQPFDYIIVPREHYETLLADLIQSNEAYETQVHITQLMEQAYIIMNRPWYIKLKDVFIYGKLKIGDFGRYIKRGYHMFCVWFSFMPFLGDYPNYPFVPYATSYAAWIANQYPTSPYM